MSGVDPKLSVLPAGMRLSAARAKAYEHMPYFSVGIQSLVPKEFPGLGTLGVTEQSVLMVDSEALGQWTAPEAGGVVLHEYMHIFLRHSERFREMERKGIATLEDARLWNVAADCEINDNLAEAHIPLPDITSEDGSTISAHYPAKYDLPAHRPAEEYFIALKKKRDEDGDDGDQGSGPGWGQCGSGAGNPIPGEPENDPDGRSPIEQHVQRQSDAEQIQAAVARGNVPAGIAREANATLTPPVVSWQRRLEHRLGKAVSTKAGAVDYTFDHRCRIQGALEIMLGEECPVLPGMNAPSVNVALVIDTSGSMGDPQIIRLVSEAQGIIKSQGGAKLSIVVCDAEVHAVAEVKEAGEIRQHIAGGGGTDFVPAFEALASLKTRPDVVVFGTDGYGRYPDAPPKGMDVIWLNLDGDIGVDWGEVINISVGDQVT